MRASNGGQLATEAEVDGVTSRKANRPSIEELDQSAEVPRVIGNREEIALSPTQRGQASGPGTAAELDGRNHQLFMERYHIVGASEIQTGRPQPPLPGAHVIQLERDRIQLGPCAYRA